MTEAPSTHSYHRQLQERVTAWLHTEEAAVFPGAHLYAHLPDLFLVLAHLALDERLPDRDRAGILSALKYIVAPFDLIPEGILGTSALRDDLVLAALVVNGLECRVPHAIVEEHWSAAGDPLAIARAVLDAAGSLVDDQVAAELATW